VLTKGLEEISELEPGKVREAFQGKKMRCEYEWGSFDETLIESLPSGVGKCEGELKRALYALRIIEYEIMV
jgi:hypothetical protein